MADFHVPLEQGGVDQGLGEFVAHAGFLGCAGCDVVVGSVVEGAALAVRVEAVVGDVAAGEFDFGFLLSGWVS